MTPRCVSVLLVTAVLLGACGLKGPLYLPDPADETKTPPPAKTTPAPEKK